MSLLYRDTFQGTPGSNAHARASDFGGTFFNYGGGNLVLASGGGAYASGSARLVAPVDVNDIEIEATLNVKSTGVATHYAGITLAVNSSVQNTYGATFFNYVTASYVQWAQFNKAGTVTNPYLMSTSARPYLSVGEHKVIFSRKGDIFRSWVDGREMLRWKPSSTYLGAFVRPGIFSDGGSATASTGTHFKQFDVYDTRSDFNQIQVVGDSQVQTADGSNGYTTPADQWATRLMGMMYADGWVGRWANVGVNGKRLDTMETNATQVPANQQSLTQGPTESGTNYGWGVDVVMNPGKQNIIVLEGLYNDIAQGANAATCLSRIRTYIANRRAAGHKVVVLTLVHCGWGTVTGGTVSDSAGNAIVDTVNAALIADYAAGNFEGLARPDQVAELNDWTNATYRAAVDKVHWLPAAQPFIAQAVYAPPKAVAIPRLTRWVGNWPGAVNGRSPFNLGPCIL